LHEDPALQKVEHDTSGYPAQANAEEEANALARRKARRNTKRGEVFIWGGLFNIELVVDGIPRIRSVYQQWNFYVFASRFRGRYDASFRHDIVRLRRVLKRLRRVLKGFRPLIGFGFPGRGLAERAGDEQ
jgi:hypothetical protein